jgi:ParB family transcriptional regulator, chromosome partitioning protein
MSRRSGLGRGLAALIPPAPQDGPQAPAQARGDGSDDAEFADDTEEEGFRIIPGPAGASVVAEQPDEQPDERREEPADDLIDDPVEDLVEDPVDEHPADPEPAVPDGAGATSPEPDQDASVEAAPRVSGPEPVSAPDEPAAPPEPPAGVTATTATLMEVAPDRIDPNPSQPLDVFDPDELEGLATSLLDIGVLQPLVVRPAANGRYELIAGERRWRAAQLAELATVPVVVRHTDDADLLKEALVENIHRVQLNPLEEAAAYQQLLEEFGVTQEELATRLGRSRPSISNAIRLLQLPAAVQRRLAAGVLSAGHAKVLLAMDDAGSQTRLAERIIAEGLSVRATEELVRLQLIDGPTRSPKPRRTPTAPGLVELQEDLSDALETRVRITMGARKGRLAIEFASVDDLERIVGVIAGGISGSGSPRDQDPTDD